MVGGAKSGSRGSFHDVVSVSMRWLKPTVSGAAVAFLLALILPPAAEAAPGPPLPIRSGRSLKATGSRSPPLHNDRRGAPGPPPNQSPSERR